MIHAREVASIFLEQLIVRSFLLLTYILEKNVRYESCSSDFALSHKKKLASSEARNVVEHALTVVQRLLHRMLRRQWLVPRVLPLPHRYAGRRSCRRTWTGCPMWRHSEGYGSSHAGNTPCIDVFSVYLCSWWHMLDTTGQELIQWWTTMAHWWRDSWRRRTTSVCRCYPTSGSVEQSRKCPSPRMVSV